MLGIHSKKRFLTEIEIADIVSVIPLAGGATLEVSQLITSQIRSKNASLLREVEIYPENIPLLKKLIYLESIKSTVPAGETIGMTSGEAIGQPATQSSLSGFHNTGSARNVGSAIDTIRELLNNTKTRRVETSTIHFKDKNLTYEDVLGLRRHIVGVTMAEVTRKSVIVSAVRDGEFIPVQERGDWYESYLNIVRPEYLAPGVLTSSVYLRLTFDRSYLYQHAITLGDIVNVLESELSHTLKCIPSPSTEETLVIDVYPDQNTVVGVVKGKLSDRDVSLQSLTVENASYIVLYTYVRQALGEILVSGIPGITHIFPQTVPILSVVREKLTRPRDIDLEEALKLHRSSGADATQLDALRSLHSRTWIMWFDRVLFKIRGIPIRKFTDMLRLCGFNILSAPVDPEVIPEHSRIRKRPPTRVDSENFKIVFEVPVGFEGDPMDYIKARLNAEEREMVDTYKAQKKGGMKYPTLQSTPLIKAGYYSYAETNGQNLREMLRHPLIDPTRTISNNPNDIYHLLGIQAAQNFTCRDFYDVIVATDSLVSPRHISTIVSFMTHGMGLMAITSRSVARQGRGAYSEASFEQPVAAFLRSATVGAVEGVKPTSTGIFLGIRGSYGTGAFKVVFNEVEAQKIVDACKASKETFEPASLPPAALDFEALEGMMLPSDATLQFGDDVGVEVPLRIDGMGEEDAPKTMFVGIKVAPPAPPPAAGMFDMTAIMALLNLE